MGTILGMATNQPPDRHGEEGGGNEGEREGGGQGGLRPPEIPLHGFDEERKGIEQRPVGDQMGDRKGRDDAPGHGAGG